MLFPNSLALIDTTDKELDTIIFDLDSELKAARISDDTVYVNNKYFFSNMKLARFNTLPTKAFRNEVEKISNSLKFEPYQIDSVTLAICNAVFQNRSLKKTWKLN